MESSLYGLVIALVIFLIWFWNSLYVIKEWERGVVLAARAHAAGRQRRRIAPGFLADRDAVPHFAADRDAGRSLAGHHYARQRFREGERGRYFRVVDANLALSQVQNYLYATSQKAQTTLRSIVGQFELDEILAEREKVNSKLQMILDQDTEPWGIKVTKVEVKQVDIPEQMQRAIGRQAEAERERRAKIIHAEGEAQASAKLAEAAKVLETQPAAIQLRYLQTLTEIGVEKNTTIVFPLPIDIINEWVKSIGSRKVDGIRGRKSGGDFVLESRHLVGLFLLLVVIFGVVFTLGYLMGRSQYDSKVRAAAGTPLEAEVPASKPAAKMNTKPESEHAQVPKKNSDWDFYHSADPQAASDHLQPPAKPVTLPKPVVKSLKPSGGAVKANKSRKVFFRYGRTADSEGGDHASGGCRAAPG